MTNSLYRCLVWVCAFVRNTMHYWKLEQEYFIWWLTQQYYIIIQFQGSQVIDSPASTFEVQRNRYDKQLQVIQSWKFESWKIHIIIIKPYVKLGSITTNTSSKHSCSQEIANFVTWWFCIYNSSTNTNAFFKVIS